MVFKFCNIDLSTVTHEHITMLITRVFSHGIIWNITSTFLNVGHGNYHVGGEHTHPIGKKNLLAEYSKFKGCYPPPGIGVT